MNNINMVLSIYLILVDKNSYNSKSKEITNTKLCSCGKNYNIKMRL